MSGGGARGQNVVHPKCGISTSTFPRSPYTDNHFGKHLIILRPYVKCRVLFHSMTSDPRVHGQGSEFSSSLKWDTSVFSRTP